MFYVFKKPCVSVVGMFRCLFFCTDLKFSLLPIHCFENLTVLHLVMIQWSEYPTVFSLFWKSSCFRCHPVNKIFHSSLFWKSSCFPYHSICNLVTEILHFLLFWKSHCPPPHSVIMNVLPFLPRSNVHNLFLHVHTIQSTSRHSQS